MIFKYPYKGFATLIILIILNGLQAAFAQAPKITYPTTQNYTQFTAITPIIPKNAGGNVPATFYGEVTTIAGSGQKGADNGTGKAASFKNPIGIVVDATGNIFVSDTYNHLIRKITPQGLVTTFAGHTPASGLHDGIGVAANFVFPFELAIDKAGNIYVAEEGTNEIREISPTAVVTTLAGNFPQQGAIDGIGNGATFRNPIGVAVDAAGNIYVADTFNYLLRKITPAGKVTTIAGTVGVPGIKDGLGTAASFLGPNSLAVDKTGNLYLTDNALIRKITPAGLVTTFAGNVASSAPKDGIGTAAGIGGNGITIDQLGDIYVADGSNLIRKITTGAVVTTIAGSGVAGSADGVGKAATFNSPWGITNDGLGSLYVTDYDGNQVRKVTLTGYTIDKPLPDGLSFDATTGTISGTPNFASPATNYTITGYNADGSSGAVISIRVIASTTPPTVPPNVTYKSPQVYPVKSAILPLSPNNTGGPVTGTALVSTLAVSTAQNIVADKSGNLYVTENNQVKKISPTGVVTVFAGSGAQGSANGTGITASFNMPLGMAIDAAGNLYVADSNNNLIRKITPAGLVSNFAGTGAIGSTDGAAKSASFYNPNGMVFDAAGNLYVADFSGCDIRKITSAGQVSTLAGLGGTAGYTDASGKAARFTNPEYLAIDASGNIYVSDIGNNRIRIVTPDGDVSTFAGNGNQGLVNGPGISASFDLPRGLTVDASGNLYVVDQVNNVIRKITPAGIVSTFAGTGAQGSIDGPISTASFTLPDDVTIDAAGNLYLVSSFNGSVRKIVNTYFTIFPALPAGLTFDTTTGIITGTPTVGSPAKDYTITDYNAAGLSISRVNITVVDNTVQPPAITYQTPQVYTQNKKITPLNPNNTGGAVSNTVYTSVSTLPGLSFADPTGMVFDKAGNLYVTEFATNTIKKVTPAGVASVFAGTGSRGSDNGPGATASFFAPYGLAIDVAGNIYVADEGNLMIRKITPDGKVSTLAGSGNKGSTNGNGTSASFNNPIGVVCDAAGNVYVADRGNSLIRQITPSGSVSTYAVLDGGVTPGTNSAGLGFITIDAAGNLYVTDGNQVKKIDPSRQVSIIAGGGAPGFANGTGTSAAFNRIVGIVLDAAGDIYIGDAGNNAVRKVTQAGVVTTVAGGTRVQGNQDGSVTTATFFAPYGVAIDAGGNLYAADAGNNAVRKITKSPYTIDKALPAGLTFDNNTGIISGTPTVTSPPTPYTITAYNAGGSSSFKVTISVIGSTIPVAAPVITYPTPNVYNVGVTIPPLVPNTSGGGPVPPVIFGVTTTFAGKGTFGNSNGAPLDATFRFPEGDAIDASGNIYVADYSNNLIRKITPAGITSTYAGTGVQGANNGAAIQATFDNPMGVAVDAAGNVYVDDYGNNMIRKIAPDGTVSTLAGDGFTGANNGTGTGARFNLPTGVAVDAAGNVYVADKNNNVIRKISPGGVVITFAGSGAAGSTNGTGTAASFNGPQGIAVDAAGNIYVTDSGNNLIRMITPGGVVTTIAGSGQKGAQNGLTMDATFNNPMGLVVDVAGNIFIADYGNNMIRMITPQGNVTTLAGNGTFGGFNNTGVVASFAGPSGLTIDAEGNLFVADKFNNVIREIATTGYYIDKPLPEGLKFDSMTGIISGTPTTPKPTTIYTITAYNEGGNGSFQVSITVVDKDPTTVSPPNFTYETPQIYTVNTLIASLSPQNNGGGAVPATNFGEVSTFAGSGTQGSGNALGTAASFSFPHDVTVDRQGFLYVADDGNYMIRQITSGGLVSTLAGSGVSGSNNGKGALASFLGPVGVTVDGSGNVFVADLKNNLIRKITPDGTASTVAGKTGVFGATNGIGTAASFNYPSGVAVDAEGNIYVADPGNNLIRKITPNGIVTTMAGTGIGGANNGAHDLATFNSPEDVAVDKDGNVYVADDFNNMIRKISPAGVVSTFAGSTTAGSADGQGTAASFNRPVGIAIDLAGNLYVGDTGNDKVRLITPQGLVTTLAGSGSSGKADGIRFQATFNQPSGLAADELGNVFLADNANHLIRKIIATGYTIDKTLPAGLTFDGTTGTISGTPTVISPATDYVVTGYNAGGSFSFTINITVKDIVLVPQTITFAPILNKTYSDADFDPGATSTNTTIPITYTSDNTATATIVDGKIHITGAGTSNITASQAAGTTYIAAEPVSQLLTVNKAQLTIHADDKSKTAGTDNPLLTVTYGPFAYNEDKSVLTMQPRLITFADINSIAGEYPITFETDATAANYTFDEIPGTLTIKPPLVKIVVPNTFTPNGDGVNDVWNIKALIDLPQCTVDIYTRYGSHIYHSKGYPQPWDGIYSGSQLPVGTYYFIIDPENGSPKLSGYVTIIR